MNTPLVLLPVLVILIIAVTTRRTLFPMLCGLVTASVLLAVFSGGGVVGNIFKYLYISLSNETLQWLLIVISLFGILIHFFDMSGAVAEFGAWAGRFLNTRRSALVGAWQLGVIIFIDDYLSNLAAGTTMKSVTDRYGVPRTLLGYIVNSTAAPVCVLVPVSTWAAYFAGLFEEQGVMVNGSGMGAYLQAIPFLFYGWACVLVALLVALGAIPLLGPLKREDAAFSAAAVKNNETDEKANPLYFLVPLAGMVAVTILTGVDSIMGPGAEMEVLTGVGAGAAIAFVLYLATGKLKFSELLNTAFDGIKNMEFVLILCVLAFAVQAANTDLGLAQWVIATVEPLMYGAFLPAAVFVVCAAYAYATGAFWDMAVIIIPVVIPLAHAMGVNPVLAGAAVFSGAVFGSHTCLYGDGLILASQSCETKAADLMLATLPYALISGGVSVVLYLVAGFLV